MSSAAEYSRIEKSRIYETVFSSPGMTENCKINLQLSRQIILILSRIIEQGINADKQEIEEDMITLLQGQATEELKRVVEELLKKGGLTEFYGKLKSL